MGGIAVDLRDILPDGEPHPVVALSPEGVLQLARLGHFIYIPSEKIGDKSKQDLVQKTLVISQMLWMCLQTVTRAVAGLPLTLLEIHTLVHVFCAFLMYACWMKVGTRTFSLYPISIRPFPLSQGCELTRRAARKEANRHPRD